MASQGLSVGSCAGNGRLVKLAWTPRRHSGGRNRTHLSSGPHSDRRLLPVTNGYHSEYITLSTTQRKEVVDITSKVQEVLRIRNITQGIVCLSSMHTTCAIVVNENEHFLKEDVLDYFGKTVPEEELYKHNQIDKRPATERDRTAILSNNCGGFESVEAFMQAEPINAHAHLQSILCGNSETLGVDETGRLILGQWQSILFVDFDGPREGRKVAITIISG